MDDVERALLEAGSRSVGSRRFVQLATAAAPEGASSLARWHALGLRAADRVDARQVVVPVVDRDSADDAGLAALVDGAALIYLSGGNPGFLTETLRDTAVWRAVLAAWHGGAALAGCSAGAMALSGRVPRIRDLTAPPIPGLGVVPGIEVIPHFDAFDRRFPTLVATRLADAAPGLRLVGIDEDTALATGLDDAVDGSWVVRGHGSAWLLDPAGGRRRVEDRLVGEAFRPLAR
jgi:cyanophycinase